MVAEPQSARMTVDEDRAFVRAGEGRHEFLYARTAVPGAPQAYTATAGRDQRIIGVAGAPRHRAGSKRCAF